MKKLRHIIVFYASLNTIVSCKKVNENDQAINCMERVLKLDDSLGSIRNHSSEKVSLSKTIADYTYALDNLNYEYCPEDFKSAFKKHAKAWQDMIMVTNQYPDLRGEIHDLFNQIEVSSDSLLFKNKLKQIWDTWSIIEDASKSNP